MTNLGHHGFQGLNHVLYMSCATMCAYTLLVQRGLDYKLKGLQVSKEGGLEGVWQRTWSG